MGTHEYEALMDAARYPGDMLTLAFCEILSRSAMRGMDTEELGRLRDHYFPEAGSEIAFCFEQAGTSGERAVFRNDEMADIVQLLLEHRRDGSEEIRWLAHAIAAACLGNDHLWRDMGLSSRDVLSDLLRGYFGPLYEKNAGNMKWKKFFYKLLCERAEVKMCKAPSCNVCTDYAACFGPEDGPPSVGC